MKDLSQNLFRFSNSVIVEINKLHHEVLEIKNNKIVVRQIYYSGNTPETIVKKMRGIKIYDLSEVTAIIKAGVKDRNIIEYLINPIPVIEDSIMIQNIKYQIESLKSNFIWNGDKIINLSTDHLENISRMLESWEPESTMNGQKISYIYNKIQKELLRRSYCYELTHIVNSLLEEYAKALYIKGINEFLYNNEKFKIIEKDFELEYIKIS